ncbi:glycoside hydrolase family 2 TIM barrel-domain containing protein [Amycolatopsis sp. PS_44_ISF1]|uniref:glycoside hydrolase family 2 TIM barrel-domain containing protein n=1 Tax=Amycolatopsis sp. PS_44_ISF1 TaxID=2974917 RepID=UPI0028DE9E44|nr:glycoside hydrolase family 2 TIM barrel-domain containing protein [Amycolatopsis sp. PS_44_ISF1]MDT8912577.1 right-handed parallel beta-helix repeat-containing protein [Amycolatopsis sp. PS_44_ISF1]
MPRTTRTLVLAMLVAGIPVPAAAAAGPPSVLSAAPSGTGTACSLPAPCSLETAKRLAAGRSENGDVTVRLDDGEYRLTEPLRFTEADSGRHGHRITYTAAAGAKPVLSGAEPVSGWQPDPADPRYWSAPMPNGTDGTDPTSIYVDGVRAVAARGFGCRADRCRTDERGITGIDPALAAIADPAGLRVVISARWRDFHCPVQKIEGRTAVIAPSCWSNANRPTETGWESASPRGQAYQGVDWFEGRPELLGPPGQFAVDRAAHRLRYRPRPGEDLRSARVELPGPDRLLRLEGTLDHPVHDLSFTGLTFTGTGWDQAGTPDGYVGAQAGYHLTGAHSGTLPGAGEDYQRTPAAAEVSGGQRIRFAGDVFTHLGGAGVTLAGGTRDSRIDDSTFTDLSGGGVFVGDLQHAPADPRAKAAGNVVAGNTIDHTGQDYRDSVGITGGYADGLEISHNSVSDVPYTGISVGWGWNFTGTGDTQRDVLVRANSVHRFMLTLHDGGAIYTQAQSPGSRVEDNDIQFAPGVSANGIYCDERSRFYTVQRNVVQGAKTAGTHWFSAWAPWSGHLVVQDNWTDQPIAPPHDPGPDKTFQRNAMGLSTLPAAAAGVVREAGARRSDPPRQVRFTGDATGVRTGLTTLDVSAPADTLSVRYSVDDTAVAEVTRHYADGIGSAPSWRTLTDASWFPSGVHRLTAEAVTAQGPVRASTPLVTRRAADPAELTGSWDFAPAEALPSGVLAGDAPAAVQPGFRDAALRKVLVPDSYGAVRDAWNDDSGGQVLYRREVWQDGPSGVATLTFDGCSFACNYWVNGQRAGTSTGGHLPTSLEVGGLLHPGRNVLAVIADNTASLVRSYGINTDLYWNWGGLTQGVRLERTGPVAVRSVTADGAADGALTLRALTVNTTGQDRAVPVEVSVTDAHRKTVLRTRATITAPRGGGRSPAVPLRVPGARLWSPGDPALYTVTVAPAGGPPVTTRTGFRTITTTGGEVVLNGHPLRDLRGFNRHADYPGLGRTQPDALAHQELKTMRDRGFTLLRPAHYPTTPGELAAADELGILVLEEVPVTQATATQLASAKTVGYAEDMLHRMIDRDRGHPAVFAWSVGNENATNTGAGAAYVGQLIGYGRALDPTRLYTHVTAWRTADEGYGYDDFVASNQYAGWYYGKPEDIAGDMDAVQAAAGGKPIVLSEYGADAAAGLDLAGKGGEYYQAALIDTYNRLLENRPHTLGRMIWTSTEFALTPGGATGDTYGVPGYHTKGLISYDRRHLKLAGRVITSPVRMDPLPARTGPGPITVTLRSVTGQGSGGVVRLDGDDRFTAAPVPFVLPPGGTTTVTLRVSPAPGHTPGRLMVRAVVDDRTEALPRPLTIEE